MNLLISVINLFVVGWVRVCFVNIFVFLKFVLWIIFLMCGIEMVFIENLFRFIFSNRSVVCLLLVSLLYMLVYLFLVWEVLIICLIKFSMDGDIGW